MSHELGSTFDIAIVELVMEESIDGDYHRLLHFVRHHCAYHWLHFSERTLDLSENLTTSNTGETVKELLLV